MLFRSSILEYFGVIDRLTKPPGEGGSYMDAFHLVIPTLPGFGFSGPTREAGWDTRRIAHAWIELMRGLGYERYGAAGGDWGSYVSLEMGRQAPEELIGAHVSQIFLAPPGGFSESGDLTQDDREAIKGLEWFDENMSSYDAVQSQQPETLAFALADSPAGWLAWVAQIFRDGVDDEFVLENAALYWLTGTIASAARIYYEHRHAKGSSEPTRVPVGLAMFKDDYKSFRSLAMKAHPKLIRWKAYEVGGHWPAFQVPEIWAADLREFFRAARI